MNGRNERRATAQSQKHYVVGRYATLISILIIILWTSGTPARTLSRHLYKLMINSKQSRATDETAKAGTASDRGWQAGGRSDDRDAERRRKTQR